MILEKINGNPGKALQVFLMASFAYYQLDSSLISDAEFDRVAQIILGAWDTLEHPHKYLVCEADLVAGTGYAIKEYPTIIRDATWAWVRAAGK